MADTPQSITQVQNRISPEVAELLERYPVRAEVLTFLAKQQCMFINGEEIAPHDGKTLEVFEPSTGGSLTHIPIGNTADVDAAISAARGALSGDWGTMKPNTREKILLKLAELIERDSQILAEIETLDNGKAIGPCHDVDILGSADLLRYMAGFATKIQGATRQVSAPGQHLAMTVMEPVGVVGAIVPWNWPFSMAMWKLAAPLAAGCAIVLKPSEQTSLSMLYFTRLCTEAGLPAGVLNIVTGDGAILGQHLCAHSGINKISFTGSTEVGRKVGSTAVKALSQVTLELGGKSPMIVFPDADLAAAAQATRWSVFFNAGQVCSAGSRMYVHETVLDQMLDQLRAVVDEIKMAPGLDPECDIGPVISAVAKDRILRHIKDGLGQGATLVAQGAMIESDGHFVAPTILLAPRNDLRIVQEEIFGPVLTVIPFSDEDEAIFLANDNIYGLAASVWTRDVSRALRISSAVDAGVVWVNAHDLADSALPFGGVKASGFGRDMGPEQLQYFLKTKTVWIAAEPRP